MKEEYKTFISTGTVSNVRNSRDKIPITILQDTGLPNSNIKSLTTRVEYSHWEV